MAIKVEIDRIAIDKRSGTTKTGSPYSFVEQNGFAFIGTAKYPIPFKFTIADENKPYPVGLYECHIEDNLITDRNNKLAFKSELVLVSAK